MKNNVVAALYAIADATFGPMTKGIEWSELKTMLHQIDESETVGKYFALAILLSILSIVLGIAAVIVVQEFFYSFFDPMLYFLPIAFPVATVSIFMIRPIYVLSAKRRTINASLPLAILTMSAVVEAGAPPQFMFKSIAESEDFPRLSKEIAKIDRYVNELGLSLTESIETVIEKTASTTLQRFLVELNTSIKTGGDLKEFMKNRADKAYFDYMLSLQQASKRAETFGDIYTAVMIAAPLFLFSSVLMLGIFGGNQGLFGYSVEFLLNVSIFYAIPLVNVMFIVAMELLTPESG